MKIYGFKEKEILWSRFEFSNIDYCPLIWDFCSSISLDKILYNNVSSDYESILNKSGKSIMEVTRKYYPENILNTKYNESRIHERNVSWGSILYIKTSQFKVNKNHAAKYENKRLSCLDHHIWNSLPNQLKKETDYSKFNEVINDVFGMNCKCNYVIFWSTIPHRISETFLCFSILSNHHIITTNWMCELSLTN